MKSIRLRFTIRRLMVAVAIAALVFAGEIARRRWSAMPTPTLSRARMQAIGLAAKHLGPGHWATSKDRGLVMHDAARGYWLYARDYRSLGNGEQVLLSPFVAIWQSPDGRRTKTVVGDWASLHLDGPPGRGTKAHQVSRARIEGNVVIRDDKAALYPAVNLFGDPLSALDLDETSLANFGGISEPSGLPGTVKGDGYRPR